MPFHRVPYCAKVTLKGAHGDDPRETVLHYRRAAALPDPTSTDLDSLLGVLVAAGGLVDTFLNCISNTTTYTEIRAVDVNRADGASATRVFAPPKVGAKSGDVLPGGENLAIIKTAAVAGRGKNGRVFIPDIVESDQNDSVIGAGLIGNISNLILKLAATVILTYGNWVPVIPSVKHENFWAIANWAFDTLMDTLRTRQKGKRRHKRRTTTT